MCTLCMCVLCFLYVTLCDNYFVLTLESCVLSSPPRRRRSPGKGDAHARDAGAAGRRHGLGLCGEPAHAGLRSAARDGEGHTDTHTGTRPGEGKRARGGAEIPSKSLLSILVRGVGQRRRAPYKAGTYPVLVSQRRWASSSCVLLCTSSDYLQFSSVTPRHGNVTTD